MLLHHNSDGAPGRTRTDEYEFTKLALLLLRHRGGKWRPRQESHLLPPPSQGGALIYLSYADNLRWATWHP